MSDDFYKWCVSVKDCGHVVQENSPTARQRRLGWDAAIAAGASWRDILKEKPDDGECVLVASIQNEKSVVEFGEHYVQDGKNLFRLYESSGVVAATHWLRIPELPAIHNLKHIGHA